MYQPTTDWIFPMYQTSVDGGFTVVSGQLQPGSQLAENTKIWMMKIWVVKSLRKSWKIDG